MKNEQSKNSFVFGLRPIHRSVISLIVGCILFFSFMHFTALLRLLLSWMGFALTYNTLCWLVFIYAPINLIKQKADEEDGSRAFVFAMILLATFASMFAVLILIISDDTTIIQNWILIVIVVATMILSWSLVHTIFTFHYAYMYYKNDQTGSGLEFPGNETPDYLDFAYFSFVLGCTFQVSDVGISEKRIRRVALAHGLLAFALNTFVVALTINIIAGLSK